MFVGFGDGADGTARVAHGYYIIGDVFYHNRATANDYIRADLHPWHHMYACSYPHIIAHRDGVGILQTLIAALGINRVRPAV